MRRPWLGLRSDEEAEWFVAQADLTEYDFAQMVPMRFELRRKDRAVSLRRSDALLDALKSAAARQGIPYQRFMRLAIERAVALKQRPERRGGP